MTRTPFSKKTDSLEIRIAPEVKRDFLVRCQQNERSASEVIRGLMGDYVSSAERAFEQATAKEFRMRDLFTDNRVRFAAATAGLLALGIGATPTSAADGRLEALFHWFDADGDGALADTELFGDEQQYPPGLAGSEVSLTTKGGHVPDETPGELFARVDVDGDGRITFDEMAQTIDVGSRLSDPILEADGDRDRSVSAAELAARLTELRAMAGERHPALGAALMAQGLIGAHDRDGDGMISAADLAG